MNRRKGSLEHNGDILVILQFGFTFPPQTVQMWNVWLSTLAEAFMCITF